MPTAVLLTGVTGFVGSEILYELLLRTDAQVRCLVRADSQGEATDRLRGVVERMLGEDTWDLVRERVVPLRGDITELRLGLDVARLAEIVESTTHIVHGAASVRFGLPLEKARDINVRGTAEVLRLADACVRLGTLQRLGYVSTTFVAGRHPGVFAEDDLDRRQSFRNTYERSKYEAEQMVRWRSELPVTVVRPAIVVGHSRSGATRGFNVVYWPLRLYADGVFRYGPVAPDLPVDLVPVDYVARGTVEAVLGEGQPGMTYALAAGPRATTAGEIAAMCAEVFDVAPPLLLRTPLDRLVMPAAARLAVLGPWRRYARSLRQYMPYFLEGSRFDTRNARALLEPLGVQPPLVVDFLRTVLEFARQTDFGRDREAIARREAEVAAERLEALRGTAWIARHPSFPKKRSPPPPRTGSEHIQQPRRRARSAART